MKKDLDYRIIDVYWVIWVDGLIGIVVFKVVVVNKFLIYVYYFNEISVIKDFLISLVCKKNRKVFDYYFILFFNLIYFVYIY